MTGNMARYNEKHKNEKCTLKDLQFSKKSEKRG
jgi:hypothetical protein